MKSLIVMLIKELSGGKSQGLWIVIVLLISMGYTTIYSTPAHESIATNKRLGRIEEALQVKEVNEIKEEILRLEWDDTHDKELNEYEVRRLHKLRLALPDEERYLREVRELNAEGNESSTWSKWIAF